MQKISDADQIMLASIPANTNNEYPLILRSGDSITFIHKITKEKFRQMATALLQEMDREDECSEDQDSEFDSSSPSSSNGSRGVEKDESKPNSEPVKNPEKSFLDNVASYTDADNSQVICHSFREDRNDSMHSSSKERESLATVSELEISRCETLSDEEVAKDEVADQNSLCKSNLEKSDVSLSCQSELNWKLVEDGPDELSTTFEEDSKVANERAENLNATFTENGCNNLTHNDQDVANNEDICNKSRTSAEFHIGSKNLKKYIPESPTPKRLCNATMGISKCNVDNKSLGETVAKPSEMQEVGETENENYNRLPSILTGDYLESAWQELGSFTKIEEIPTTEIKSHMSLDAVTKYLKLEILPNEYIIVRISANLKNVFVNVVKARDINSTPIATETALTVNGSDVLGDTDLNETGEYSEEQARLDTSVKLCKKDISIPNLSQVQLGTKDEETTETLQLMKVDSSECDSDVNKSILPSTRANSSIVSDNMSDERFLISDCNGTLKNVALGNPGEMVNSGNSATTMSSPELKKDSKMNENTTMDRKEKSLDTSYSIDLAVFESSSIKNEETFTVDIPENSEESVDNISIRNKLARECSPIKYIAPVEPRKNESVEHEENRNKETSILSPKSISSESFYTREELKDLYVKSSETFKSEISEKCPQKLGLEVSENKFIKSSVTEEKLPQSFEVGSQNESSEDANEEQSTEILGIISEENEGINESLSKTVDVDKQVLKVESIEINSSKKIADVSIESLTEVAIKEIKDSSPKEANISPEKINVSTERVTEIVLKESSDRPLNETSIIDELAEEVPNSSELDVVPSNQSSAEETLGYAENTLIEEIDFEKDNLLDVSVKKNFENKKGSALEEAEKIADEMNSSKMMDFKIEQKDSEACDSPDKLESAANDEMEEECTSTENGDSEYEVVDEEINLECGFSKNTEFENEACEEIDVNCSSHGNTESEDGEIDEASDKRSLPEMVESENEVDEKVAEKGSLSEMDESENELGEEIDAKLDLYSNSRKVDQTVKGKSKLVNAGATKDVLSEKIVSGNATSSIKAFANTIKSEQKKSGVAERQILEDSGCEKTESELGDDSFYINTKRLIDTCEEFSEDEAREKNVTDQSSSAENEGITEAASEEDTTENEDCKSVESLDDSKDYFKASKAASRYRFNRGKSIRDEVDSAPTRAKRYVASKLYKEVIPEHSSVTKSSKTNSKLSNGTSQAGTSSVATPKSLRSTSEVNVQNKNKLSLKKSNTVATEMSSESGNALTRKRRAQTPEVKLKTDIKVAVRSSPRKLGRTVSGETSTMPVPRSAASTSKTAGKTRSGADSVSHVSTRRTKR